eukprot:gene605-250_t
MLRCIRACGIVVTADALKVSLAARPPSEGGGVEMEKIGGSKIKFVSLWKVGRVFSPALLELARRSEEEDEEAALSCYAAAAGMGNVAIEAQAVQEFQRLQSKIHKRNQSVFEPAFAALATLASSFEAFIFRGTKQSKQTTSIAPGGATSFVESIVPDSEDTGSEESDQSEEKRPAPLAFGPGSKRPRLSKANQGGEEKADNHIAAALGPRPKIPVRCHAIDLAGILGHGPWAAAMLAIAAGNDNERGKGSEIQESTSFVATDDSGVMEDLLTRGIRGEIQAMEELARRYRDGDGTAVNKFLAGQWQWKCDIMKKGVVEADEDAPWEPTLLMHAAAADSIKKLLPQKK